jgi:hypothetical protein
VAVFDDVSVSVHSELEVESDVLGWAGSPWLVDV